MQKNTLPIFVTRIAVCIFAVSMTMLAPLITLIGADFDRGLWASGLLFTAYYISNLFFCLVSGKIIGLMGKRAAMAGGVGLYAVVTFAFAHAHSFWLACVLISCMGALATFIEAVGMDIVDTLAADAAASNLAVTHGFAGVGSVLGVTYSGVMLALGYDWRMIYTVLSLAVAAVTLAFCLTRFPKMETKSSGSLHEVTGILRNRTLYPTFLALFLYVGAEAGVTGWMATYMTDRVGYSALTASLGTALIWAMVTVGRMLCARLVLRYTVRRIVCTLAVICIVSIFAAVLLPWQWSLWLALIGIGAGISGMWPLIASTGLGVNENGGTILSIILMFGYFGSSIIPYAVGQIGERCGMSYAIFATAAVFALMGLTVARLIPREVSERRTE